MPFAEREEIYFANRPAETELCAPAPAVLIDPPAILTIVALLDYAMAALGRPTPATVALTAVLLASAAVIVYATRCMPTTAAFWLVKVENLADLFYSIFFTGRFPVSAFPA